VRVASNATLDGAAALQSFRCDRGDTYLAGPEAGFVTGASFTIDGDFTASAHEQLPAAERGKKIRVKKRTQAGYGLLFGSKCLTVITQPL
jgi:hypothetical protein